MEKQTQENVDSSETTHFGFRTVAKNNKAEMVAEVFHSVAAKYDLMNDLMSFGVHRIWKRYAIDCSGVRRGQRVLDLAGGTGDLTAKFSRLVGEQGEVVLADINDSMLKMGREKLRNSGIVGNVSYVQANAEALPVPEAVSLATSATCRLMPKRCLSLTIISTVSLSLLVCVT